MFLGRKVNFVAKLPTGKHKIDDLDDQHIQPYKENLCAHKQMKKIMKRMEKQEALVELELPPLEEPLIELLDDLNF